MATALYRKYRPDNFENIIGQSQVTDVLKNQIKENKISHAYIFSGTRGTGKTSTAKVFARAINCLNYDDEKGPCNECEHCVNNHIDTVEIDAASNNSVDNIRQLKDTIMYQPSFGAYKTYIIDEVHMLSTGAFNALLKTLEEPPSHVIFILATTELQKIPSTIISRCQKFEFKKVSANHIKSRLIDVLNKENLNYDEEAVEYISNISDGGLRDALSMLDQVSSYGDINMENIDFVTGQTSIEKIDEFISYIFEKKSFNAISIVNEVIKASIDVKKLPLQVITRLIDILYIQNGAEKEDILNIERLKDISKKVRSENITNLITDISEIENEMKYSNSPDILFQAFVIKQCRETVTKDNLDIQVLLQKIEELENKVNELKSAKNIYISEEKQENYKEVSKPKPKLEDIKPQDDISEDEKEQINFLNSILNDVHSLLRERKSVHLSALLHEGNIRRYVDDYIYISYSRMHNFHKVKIEQEENLIALQRAFNQILSKQVNLVIVFDDEIIEIKKEENDDNDMIKNIENLLGENVKIEILDE